MSYMHIGKDFTPPDIFGKVTGKAKYAEDFTADGMAYARLLVSPMPHARVKNWTWHRRWPWMASSGCSPPTTCPRLKRPMAAS